MSDVGFIALVDAIEKNPNEIVELSFVENCISDKSANYLVEMIKRLRVQDVTHRINLVSIDLSKN